jgi:hypothetical protein
MHDSTPELLSFTETVRRTGVAAPAEAAAAENAAPAELEALMAEEAFA